MDQVLLAAELEFSKILVPRLLQHTSNVNIECWMYQKVRMVKTTVFFICDQLLGAMTQLIILILICFYLMMPGVNYVIYGCSSARLSLEVSLYRSLFTLEENIFAVITQDRVIDDSLKRQIKNWILCTRRLFLLT